MCAYVCMREGTFGSLGMFNESECSEELAVHHLKDMCMESTPKLQRARISVPPSTF